MPADAGPLAGLSDRTFDAVLFDLDGTLVDSTGAVDRSWVALATEFGLDPARLLGFHGVPARGIVDALLPPEQRAPALARISEIELSDTDGIDMLPGAERALRDLSGAPVAIATSCTAPLAAARIRAAGVPVPAVLVTVDDVAHGKPAPDPFLLAASRLGMDPARCLVVEDAPMGLQAAREAGCATLAVTTSADGLLADAVVGTLYDVRFRVGPEGIRVRRA